MGSVASALSGLAITSQLGGSFNPHFNAYKLGTGNNQRPANLPFCVTPLLKQLHTVQEY
jgi:hypothetical protein